MSHYNTKIILEWLFIVILIKLCYLQICNLINILFLFLVFFLYIFVLVLLLVI